MENINYRALYIRDIAKEVSQQLEDSMMRGKKNARF